MAKGVTMGIDHNGFLSQDIARFTDKLLIKHQDLFTLACEVNRFSQEIMLNLNAHNEDLQEILSASLLIRCISHYQASIILSKNGMISDAKIIARALIEAMFILVAISKDYQVALDYVHEDEFRRKKALRRYEQLHNSPPPDWTDKKMTEFTTEIEKTIKDNSLKIKTTEAWAKAADMYSWYLSPYFILSDTVHVKSRDISDYVVTDSNNNPKEFKWGPSEEGVRIVLGTVIESICIIIKNIANVFNIDAIKKVDNFIEVLHNIDLNDRP